MPSRKRSKQYLLTSLSSAVLTALFMQPAAAYEFDKPIENAFKLGQDDAKYGQFKVNLRYRYELADVANNGKETAHANTLRLRLGYLTPEFHGLQAFAEFEGNVAMQGDYHAPKADWKGDPSRQVVADPQAAELNQAYMTYKGIEHLEIKGGRQRIIVNDSRFIGNVGWRQMEQTYDAALITTNFLDNDLTAQVGYIGNVKNIWSQDDAVQLPFANINFKIRDIAKIHGYGYWLSDYDAGQAGRSAQTYGVAVTGSPKINKQVKLHYRAEYGFQTNLANNPNSFTLGRYSLMGGASFIGLTAKAGVEELGANGTQAFQTPFGTNHKFQGWADQFLATPKDGVRDVNASLGGKVLGTKLMFVYHNFQSVTNSIDYGNEFDFLVTKKFGKHYQLLAKYAYYDADSRNSTKVGANDVHKFWLQGSVSF